jgi:hypothetical protein
MRYSRLRLLGTTLSSNRLVAHRYSRARTCVSPLGRTLSLTTDQSRRVFAGHP